MARRHLHHPVNLPSSICVLEKCCEIKPVRQISSGWGHGVFPPGPWETEPDRVDFSHCGLQCMVHRNGAGAWCGYVAVPRSHPAFGHPYDDFSVRVHGGLTYSDKCQGHICHLGPRKWWIGFDCAHAFDLMPAMVAFREDNHYIAWERHEIYRDLDYVMKETRELASQLKGTRVPWTQKPVNPERLMRRLKQTLKILRQGEAWSEQ